MGMSYERSQFAQLVIKKLRAYQEAEVPLDSIQFAKEIYGLLELHQQSYLQALQEVKEALLAQFPPH